MVQSEWILNQFAANRAWARRKYEEFVLDGIGAGHRGSFARAVVAYLGQELGAIKLNEVAARYGRDQVTLSLGIKRLREGLAQESDLSENIASLLNNCEEDGSK